MYRVRRVAPQLTIYNDLDINENKLFPMTEQYVQGQCLSADLIQSDRTMMVLYTGRDRSLEFRAQALQIGLPRFKLAKELAHFGGSAQQVPSVVLEGGLVTQQINHGSATLFRYTAEARSGGPLPTIVGRDAPAGERQEALGEALRTHGHAFPPRRPPLFSRGAAHGGCVFSPFREKYPRVEKNSCGSGEP